MSPKYKRHNVRRCIVSNCDNTSLNATLFRLPKDEERCSIWLKNCNRLDLAKFSSEHLYRSYRLCYSHFKEDMFAGLFASVLKNKLHPDAVPTIFSGSEDVHNSTQLNENESVKSSEDCHFTSTPLEYLPETSDCQEIQTQGRPTIIDFSDRCRTCLEQRSPQTSLIFTNITKHCYVGKTFKQVIIMMVPDTSDTLNNDDLVCENCAETLKRSVALIQRCSVIEENLKKCQLFPDIKITLHSTDKIRKDVSEAKHPNDSIHSGNRSCVYANDTNNLENNSQYINVPNIILYSDMIDDTNILKNVYQQPYVPNIILNTGTSYNSIDPESVENFSTSKLNDETEVRHESREGDHEYCGKLECVDQNLDENLICFFNSMEKHDRIISLEPVDHAATETFIACLSLHGVNIRDASTKDEDNNFKRKRILLIGENCPTRCPNCKKSLKYHRDHVCRKKKRKKVPPRPSEKCTKCGRNIHAGFMKYHLKKHERDERKKQEREKRKEAKKQFRLKRGTCGVKRFEQLDSELHMETDVVVCHVCGKSLPNEDEYKTHVTEHIKLCEFCGKSFASIAALKVHIESIHKETMHICDRCPRMFRHKRQVNIHVKQVHERSGQQQCSVCGKVFINLGKCRSHYRLIHQGLKPYLCTICGKEFGRKDYMEKHQEVYHGRPRKKILKKEMHNNPTKRRGYGIRLRDPGKPVKCKICDKQFGSVHLLKIHLETHVKIKRFKCKHCELTFSRPHNRNRHEDLHAKDSENQFRCNICWKRVRTQEELEIHKNGHGKPKYSCDTCEEKFHRRYLLHNHISDNHTSSEDVDKAVEEIVVKNLLEYVYPRI